MRLMPVTPNGGPATNEIIDVLIMTKTWNMRPVSQENTEMHFFNASCALLVEIDQ